MDDEHTDNSSSTNATAAATSAAPLATTAAVDAAPSVAGGVVAEATQAESCHDSGIDIRDPLPTVQAIPTKKNYSDADIVLSSNWVPPQTIAPTVYTETLSVAALTAQHSAQSHNLEAGGRKKTSSVSFSVDDTSETSGGAHHGGSTSSDKTADKKNKMLKRLSYPLTWVEGFTADGKPDSVDSAPNTGDSGQSVFSKVFSR